MICMFEEVIFLLPFSQESLCFNSNLSQRPFCKVDLQICRMEHNHLVSHLIQSCLCIVVNSWSVLNIMATWFDFSIFEYSGNKVSISLESCWRFHAFTVLIIYYLLQCNSNLSYKDNWILAQAIDTSIFPPLGPTDLYPYLIFSFLRGIGIFITCVQIFLLSMKYTSTQRNPSSVIRKLNFWIFSQGMQATWKTLIY